MDLQGGWGSGVLLKQQLPNC